MSRIGRDEMFMHMAGLVAARGTCPRAQVGSVLVHEYRPFSIGYNGAPPGMPHCLDVGCDIQHRCEQCGHEWVGVRTPEKCVECHLKLDDGVSPYPKEGISRQTGCQRTIHAEANAIVWAARAGLSTEGATMYSTYSPCHKCAELMSSARISRLVYLKDYRAADLELLERMGISVVKYDEPS